MAVIGIDLGNKTVSLFCSDGKYITDPINKHVIPTVFDKTMPRAFGNQIRKDNRKSIAVRSNHPLSNLTDLNMFICFLDRLCINYPGCSFSYAVPFNYSDTKRRTLIQLNRRNVSSLYSQLFSLGLNFYLKREVNEFILLDFGYSQTSFGKFVHKEKSLFLENFVEIPFGSCTFDEKIINFIANEIKETSSFAKQIIFNSIDKLKEQLNSFENFKHELEIRDETYEVTIERKVIDELLSKEVNLIKDTLNKFIEENQSEVIEVTGGNSLFYPIKTILSEYNYGKALNFFDSVSYGNCYASFLAEKKRMNLYDKIQGKYLLKNEEEEIILFENPFYNSEAIVKKENKSYKVYFIFNNLEEYVGDCFIKEEETFFIDKNGLLQNNNFIIKNTLSEEELFKIKEEEKKFFLEEEEIRKIKEKKVNLENILLKIKENNKIKINQNKINELINELMVKEMPESVKEMEELEKSFINQLTEVNDFINKTNQEMINFINEYKEKCNLLKKDFFIKGVYKLTNELNKNEILSIYNLDNYDYFRKERILMIYKEAELEVKEKLEEERIKQEKKNNEEKKVKEESVKQEEKNNEGKNNDESVKGEESARESVKEGL
ncbi:DnaK-like protein [Tubulinosema ratisbonensis]|uniref:DnaK-like protein n=1 Tax=Tubulinosema ratisbonensis TaxID=291195 RepID=A0A437AI58_9MICR|nr:DnaK-like protein [Tubulinosema ratisbonensis]